MLSAINSPRPLQATATKGVAGAIINTKQCGKAILLQQDPDEDHFQNEKVIFLVHLTSLLNFHEDPISNFFVKLMTERQTNAG